MTHALINFLRGGAINHDHFTPSNFNIYHLINHGSPRILIQLRDPRDALTSLCHHNVSSSKEKTSIMNPEQYCRSEFIQWFNLLTSYLRSWAIFISTHESYPVKVLWYEDLIRAPAQQMTEVAEFFGYDHSATKISQILAHHSNQPGTFNFRKGESGQWNSFLTDSEKEIAENTLRLIILDFDCQTISLKEHLNL